MTLTEAALRYNRVTIAGLMVVMLGAFLSYFSISRAEDPAVTVRVAQVVTYMPGATPERVEQLITDPLETAIMEMPELDYVESTSRAGVSIIRVELRPDVRDVQAGWEKLRRKINDKRQALPSEALAPIINDEFGDVFGILLSLTGEGYSQAELKEVADDVRDRLLRLADVAKVSIHGYAEERIFLDYSEARLAELGVSPMAWRSCWRPATSCCREVRCAPSMSAWCWSRPATSSASRTSARRWCPCPTGRWCRWVRCSTCATATPTRP